jgi:drug/metabolite transporter (DMT)-like permease
LNDKSRIKHLEYVKGLSFTTIAVIVLSFDAILIRLSHMSSTSAAFWRALFAAISLTVIFFSTYRSQALSMLKRGGIRILISGSLWGTSSIFFAFAVMRAGVETALVMWSLGAFFAAAFSFIFYKIRPSLVTLLAALVALGGIVFIYRKGLGDIPLDGFLFALAGPTLIGGHLTYLRFNKDLSRSGILMVGATLGTIVTFFVADFNVAVGSGSLWPLAILGLFVLPFSQVLIGTGTKYAPAADIALILSTETIFGILYVWLFLREAPGLDFIFGAAIVFIAITVNSLYQSKT